VWVAFGSKAEELAVVDVVKPAARPLLRRLRPPFLAHDVCSSRAAAAAT
jgi:hypothetical protein